MTSKILYIIHNPAWTDCRVADTLRTRGYTIDHVCPPFGDDLTALDGYAAVMVGGSEEGHVAEPDDPPWVGREIAFVSDVLARGIPYLGICMGCQILAGACGGDVGGRADGLCEFGFFPVEPTAEGTSLFRDSRCFYQAHYEGVMTLPAGAVLLATGENFPVQAFRVGENAYGLQFHPDAKLERLTPDAIACDSLIGVEGAQGVDEQIRLARRHEAAIQRWTEEFVDRWIGPAAGHRSDVQTRPESTRAAPA
ncbi:MAG: gamma-glutamyl-gamma-aminobutyrate hydrolase family protein [Alphaproteobacteria bacterium]|nr:gamma-glutamyl-gamma-aminobutyrate hydrolase family protein [Alphaproteobacteria bacterium]